MVYRIFGVVFLFTVLGALKINAASTDTDTASTLLRGDPHGKSSVATMPPSLPEEDHSTTTATSEHRSSRGSRSSDEERMAGSSEGGTKGQSYRREMLAKVINTYKIELEDIYDALPSEQKEWYIDTLSQDPHAAYQLMGYFVHLEEPNNLWAKLCGDIACAEESYADNKIWERPQVVQLVARLVHSMGEQDKAITLFNESIRLFKEFGAHAELRKHFKNPQEYIDKVIYDAQSLGIPLDKLTSVRD